MSKEDISDYDSEAWGDNRSARARKFKSKTSHKKKAQHQELRLSSRKQKHRRVTKIDILENYDDYDDYDHYYTD